MKVKHVIGGLAAAGIAAVILSHHRAGANDLYPTIPGSLNPDVSQATIANTICRNGWTATIRPPASYTTALKLKQLQTGDPKAFEEDHFISLELGGNPTDPNNLWPESYPQAHWKDNVENYLKRETCAGRLTLKQAQDAIAQDWYKIYLSLTKQPTFGSVEPSNTDD